MGVYRNKQDPELFDLPDLPLADEDLPVPMSATEAKDYGVVDLIVGQTAATAAADRAEAVVKDIPTGKSSNGKP